MVSERKLFSQPPGVLTAGLITTNIWNGWISHGCSWLITQICLVLPEYEYECDSSTGDVIIFLLGVFMHMDPNCRDFFFPPLQLFKHSKLSRSVHPLGVTLTAELHTGRCFTFSALLHQAYVLLSERQVGVWTWRQCSSFKEKKEQGNKRSFYCWKGERKCTLQIWRWPAVSVVSALQRGGSQPLFYSFPKCLSSCFKFTPLNGFLPDIKVGFLLW